MMGGFGYGIGLFGGWGMVAGMVFWVVLLAVVVWAVAEYAGRSATGQTLAEESALDTLKRRYARGEINQAEYLQARKDLG